MKIYLITLESDKGSICAATFDHIKSQKWCHRLSCRFGQPMSVVTEDWSSLPWELRVTLRHNKSFKKEYDKMMSN